VENLIPEQQYNAPNLQRAAPKPHHALPGSRLNCRLKKIPLHQDQQVKMHNVIFFSASFTKNVVNALHIQQLDLSSVSCLISFAKSSFYVVQATISTFVHHQTTASVRLCIITVTNILMTWLQGPVALTASIDYCHAFTNHIFRETSLMLIRFAKMAATFGFKFLGCYL
jgi:hypothetical protein